MLQQTSCIIRASCQSQTAWNTAAPRELKHGFSSRPCSFSGQQDQIWLEGSDGQKKMLSVTTLLTNFLKLALINKEPVGVAAQGKPQAIFQLVSPERQIGILRSALREEWKQEGGRWRRGGWERIRLCFAEEHIARAKREGESGKAGKEKNCERCWGGYLFSLGWAD